MDVTSAALACTAASTAVAPPTANVPKARDASSFLVLSMVYPEFDELVAPGEQAAPGWRLTDARTPLCLSITLATTKSGY
ncbi:hypothetical protein GCM10010411_45310 [Actinomadura fulvescens]|uniref:Secreted protein n=1 Tax=Actinomadura fulvescens TaxID=46160 RepID=A0ABP6CAZ3_9ACTN